MVTQPVTEKYSWRRLEKIRTMRKEHMRLLPIEGSYNCRDIGGYITAERKVTRWQTIFRSGNLDRITLNGQTALLAYGLRTILDIRSEQEAYRYRDVFSTATHVSYLHIPLVDTTSSIWKAELVEKYILILRSQREQLRHIFQAIATADVPLLIHCTAGKDRTGLIVALLLDLVAIPRTTIRADYMLSQQYLASFFSHVRHELIRQQKYTDKFERDSQCLEQVVETTLQFLRNEYQGTQSYLSDIGLDKKYISALKERLIN